MYTTLIFQLWTLSFFMNASATLAAFTVRAMDSAGFAQAQQRDDTAVRAFSATTLQTSNGQCLYVNSNEGDGDGNHIPIRAKACNPSDRSQQWDIITSGKHNDMPGYALVVSSSTNGCMDLDTYAQVGSRVFLYSCGGRPLGDGATSWAELVPFKGSKSIILTPYSQQGRVCYEMKDGVLDYSDCDSGNEQRFTIGGTTSSGHAADNSHNTQSGSSSTTWKTTYRNFAASTASSSASSSHASSSTTSEQHGSDSAAASADSTTSAHTAYTQTLNTSGSPTPSVSGVNPASTDSPGGNNDDPDNTQSSPNDRNMLPVILGTVFGVLGALLIALLCWLCYRRRQRGRKNFFLLPDFFDRFSAITDTSAPSLLSSRYTITPNAMGTYAARPLSIESVSESDAHSSLPPLIVRYLRGLRSTTPSSSSTTRAQENMVEVSGGANIAASERSSLPVSLQISETTTSLERLSDTYTSLRRFPSSVSSESEIGLTAEANILRPLSSDSWGSQPSSPLSWEEFDQRSEIDVDPTTIQDGDSTPRIYFVL